MVFFKNEGYASISNLAILTLRDLGQTIKYTSSFFTVRSLPDY